MGQGRHEKDDQEEPKTPTNPDLWGNDKFYDTDKGSGFRIAGAVAFCLVVVVAASGIGYVSGYGSAENLPENVYVTTESTVTSNVTVKSQKTKTITQTPAPTTKTVPGPTIYRTPAPSLIPRPTVTRTIKPPRATVTKTRTRTIEIEVPAETITIVCRPRDLDCQGLSERS